jgi:acyl dehydratase
MTFIEYSSLNELSKLVGSVIGTSPTMRIDQPRIDSFAEITLDNQWIHNDPAAASEGPYGTTIAHGFLILSLITGLECQSYSIGDVKVRINYGLDKLRFITPLKVNSEIYLTTKLISIEEVKSGIKILKENTVLCPTESKPILSAERITLVTLNDQ